MTPNSVIRFRKFSNKSYAAFMSLHREVTIGVVSSDIADRELLKSGKTRRLDYVAGLCRKIGDLEQDSDERPPLAILVIGQNIMPENVNDVPAAVITILEYHLPCPSVVM